jgi:hypothetical protein
MGEENIILFWLSASKPIIYEYFYLSFQKMLLRINARKKFTKDYNQ